MRDQGTRLRVVVADDNYLVREGVRQVLELGGEVEVVDSVGEVAALLAAVERTRPDAVITDIRMPPTHTLEGIDAARTLRQDHPRLGVVVLSNHADPAYAVELFSDGTAYRAYLLKDRVGDRAQLLAALRAAAAGESVIDPVVVEGLVSRRFRTASSPVSGLNDRERSVLAAMAAGRSNTAIGAALHLSVSAVEKHISAIFAKLGLTEEADVHRRVKAVLIYLADGAAA